MKEKISFFFILVCLTLLILSPFFIKVKIECKSQFGECPSEIKSGIDEIHPKNLFDARRKSASFFKKNFLVSEYSLQFKLPNILLANILVKKPLFALIDTNSKKAALVDTNGEVLSIGLSTTLPAVNVSQELPNPGESVGNANLFALNLISGVFEMYQVRTGEIQNDSLIVDLPGSIRVIFPLEGDSQGILGALKLIYTKIRGELSGKFSQIDMRYKNPVLR